MPLGFHPDSKRLAFVSTREELLRSQSKCQSGRGISSTQIAAKKKQDPELADDHDGRLQCLPLRPSVSMSLSGSRPSNRHRQGPTSIRYTYMSHGAQLMILARQRRSALTVDGGACSSYLPPRSLLPDTALTMRGDPESP